MRIWRWRLRAAVPVVAAVMIAASCGNDGVDNEVVQNETTSSTTTTAAESRAATSTVAEDSTTTTVEDAARMEVTVRDGAVVGGAERQRVTLGQPLVIVVDADVADEVHVHGYDHTAPVAPGAPAELRFIPDVPGVFEVELEEQGLVLLRLQVA